MLDDHLLRERLFYFYVEIELNCPHPRMLVSSMGNLCERFNKWTETLVIILISQMFIFYNPLNNCEVEYIPFFTVSLVILKLGRIVLIEKAHLNKL